MFFVHALHDGNFLRAAGEKSPVLHFFDADHRGIVLEMQGRVEAWRRERGCRSRASPARWFRILNTWTANWPWSTRASARSAESARSGLRFPDDPSFHRRRDNAG